MQMQKKTAWSISEFVAIGWEVGRPGVAGQFSRFRGMPKFFVDNVIKYANIFTTSSILSFQSRKKSLDFKKVYDCFPLIN